MKKKPTKLGGDGNVSDTSPVSRPQPTPLHTRTRKHTLLVIKAQGCFKKHPIIPFKKDQTRTAPPPPVLFPSSPGRQALGLLPCVTFPLSSPLALFIMLVHSCMPYFADVQEVRTLPPPPSPPFSPLLPFPTKHAERCPRIQFFLFVPVPDVSPPTPPPPCRRDFQTRLPSLPHQPPPPPAVLLHHQSSGHTPTLFFLSSFSALSLFVWVADTAAPPPHTTTQRQQQLTKKNTKQRRNSILHPLHPPPIFSL